jgi:8-oxo-dGTP diphosphatase
LRQLSKALTYKQATEVIAEVSNLKRLYPDHPVVGVGAIILREGKLLLEKRLNEPARGKWTIPGGVVELGETLEEAVVRETLEETGLVVESPRLLDVVSEVNRDEAGGVRYHYVIVDFAVAIERGEPLAASDAGELRWVPLDEVEGFDLTGSFRRFFVKNKGKLRSAAGLG